MHLRYFSRNGRNDGEFAMIAKYCQQCDNREDLGEFLKSGSNWKKALSRIHNASRILSTVVFALRVWIPKLIFFCSDKFAEIRFQWVLEIEKRREEERYARKFVIIQEYRLCLQILHSKMVPRIVLKNSERRGTKRVQILIIFTREILIPTGRMKHSLYRDISRWVMKLVTINDSSMFPRKWYFIARKFGRETASVRSISQPIFVYFSYAFHNIRSSFFKSFSLGRTRFHVAIKQTVVYEGLAYVVHSKQQVNTRCYTPESQRKNAAPSLRLAWIATCKCNRKKWKFRRDEWY